MTQYNNTLESEDVQALFSSDEGLARVIEAVTNQNLDHQATSRKVQRSTSAQKIGFDGVLIGLDLFRSLVLEDTFILS